jgi:hypothetical protein
VLLARLALLLLFWRWRPIPTVMRQLAAAVHALATLLGSRLAAARARSISPIA